MPGLFIFFWLSDPPFRYRQIPLCPQPLYIGISLWPLPLHTQPFSWFQMTSLFYMLFHPEHLRCCFRLLSLLSPLLPCPVSKQPYTHFIGSALCFWTFDRTPPSFLCTSVPPFPRTLTTLVLSSVPESPSLPGHLLFSSLWPSALPSMQTTPRKLTVDWVYDVCQGLCKCCACVFPFHLFPQNNPMVVLIVIPLPSEYAEGQGLSHLPGVKGNRRFNLVFVLSSLCVTHTPQINRHLPGAHCLQCPAVTVPRKENKEN